MSRNHCLIALIAVMLVLVVLPAQAQFTARSQGMGNTIVAVGNDSAAWANNPALLPSISADSLISPWPNLLSVGAEVGGDYHELSVNFASRDAAGVRGWGVGFDTIDGMDVYGAGYGQTCSFVDGLTWGVAGVSVDGGVDEEFLFNLGLAYDVPLPLSKLVVAAEVWDITDQLDTLFNIGAAYYLPGDLTLALDVWDLDDEAIVNFGAEYAGPLLAGFTARAGSSDGNLTAGLGRDFGLFDLSISWMDLDGGDDSIFATAEASL